MSSGSVERLKHLVMNDNMDFGVGDDWIFGQNVVLSLLDFLSLCDAILVRELFAL